MEFYDNLNPVPYFFIEVRGFIPFPGYIFDLNPAITRKLQQMKFFQSLVFQ
jgi:hypothetical protein